MLDQPNTPDSAETRENPAPEAVVPKARVCPNCGGEFFRPLSGPGGHKRYCSAPCRQAWENRAAVDGKSIAVLAKVWAGNRNNELGNLAFARLREACDLLNNRDKDEGRVPLKAGGPLEPFIRELLAEPFLDRERRTRRR